MKTTSHFIGIKIKSLLLADLFTELYELFEANDVLDSVVFQNINSCHITLCYLDDDINEKYFLDRIRRFGSRVVLDRAGSFQDERIFYLGSKLIDDMENEYKWYQDIFKNDTVDTDLDFVPHVTLFRVTDKLKFANVRNKALRVIEDHLVKLEDIDLNNGIGLFAVNSNFQPELQLELN